DQFSFAFCMLDKFPGDLQQAVFARKWFARDQPHVPPLGIADGRVSVGIAPHLLLVRDGNKCMLVIAVSQTQVVNLDVFARKYRKPGSARHLAPSQIKEARACSCTEQHLRNGKGMEHRVFNSSREANLLDAYFDVSTV